MQPTQYIWHNGKLIPWDDATVHVMAHALHYGSSVFEGIRCYDTSAGPAIFRLDEHLHRLFNSAKMYRIPVEYSLEQVREACFSVIRENELTGAYIRPLIFRDAAALGLVVTPDHPVSVSVMAFEWGPLHGADAAEKGADICISSWTRLQSASNPVMSKAGGHYMTSQLISAEAKMNGYTDGIAVNANGVVTEGAGANLFIVRDGRLLTPSLGLSILEGITRDSVLKIAADENIEVVETDLPREVLYVADEVFMVGTAAEVAPVTSVDRLPVGDGKPGPITRRLQQRYSSIVTGAEVFDEAWLTPIA